MDVAKGISDVAAAVKTLYPNGPPVPSQSAADLPSPVFPRTRSATGRMGGVQQQVLFQSGFRAASKRSGEGEGSLGKKKGTPSGGMPYSQQLAHATQQPFGATPRTRHLEVPGCPCSTCIHHWKNKGFSLGQSCRFHHDLQAMNSISGGEHRAVQVLGVVSDEGEEGADLEGRRRQGVPSVQLQCLGVGMVLVAGDVVVVLAVTRYTVGLRPPEPKSASVVGQAHPTNVQALEKRSKKTRWLVTHCRAASLDSRIRRCVPKRPSCA